MVWVVLVWVELVVEVKEVEEVVVRCGQQPWCAASTAIPTDLISGVWRPRHRSTPPFSPFSCGVVVLLLLVLVLVLVVVLVLVLVLLLV